MKGSGIMKIINKPSLRAKCENCKCVFEFEDNDTWKEKERDNIIQMTITSYFVKCPSCKSSIKFLERGLDYW